MVVSQMLYSSDKALNWAGTGTSAFPMSNHFAAHSILLVGKRQRGKGRPLDISFSCLRL